jgi:O-antigen/teichoic acid export membrane protein
MALAAGIAGEWLARALRNVEAWSIDGSPGILRAIAPLGTWSTAGAAIHWSFSQGYTILVAATLDVRAVAAVAATRLLVMPVNLIAAGIGSLMLPLSARWFAEDGASPLLRRLSWMAAGIGAVSVCYFAVLWVVRDWVFAVVLRKDFEHRDALLALWSAALVVMAANQQLLYLLVARERFRRLTGLGAISALLALVCSWWGMRLWGSPGAPLGIFVGEIVHTFGIVALCLHETRTREVPVCGTANRPLVAADG